MFRWRVLRARQELCDLWMCTRYIWSQLCVCLSDPYPEFMRFCCFHFFFFDFVSSIIPGIALSYHNSHFHYYLQPIYLDGNRLVVATILFYFIVLWMHNIMTMEQEKRIWMKRYSLFVSTDTSCVEFEYPTLKRNGSQFFFWQRVKTAKQTWTLTSIVCVCVCVHRKI